PGRFAVWLDTPPQRARTAVKREADANGLRVLESIPLAVLGGTLVRLALADGADPLVAQQALERLGATPELRQRAILFRGARAEPGWSARRIGAEFLHASAHGDDVPIALIDSALPAQHPDLNPPAKTSRDFTGYEPAPGMHGTALGGVIAALETN